MVIENVMENIAPEQPQSRWFIDPDWYEQNKRSFFDLAQRSLCPKCTEKLGKKKKKPTTEDVLKAIQDCCTSSPDYITSKMPMMEGIFRVLLANGNQPLDIAELGKQLSERRGGDIYAASPQVLTRLLSNDRWYGFRQVTEEAKV